MAKVFRAIGTVAAIAAVIPGPHQAIAAGIAVAANVGYALTVKPPAAQGQVSDIIIGANNPQPYLMGRSYSAGVMVHDVGYGGKVNGVHNPYRWRVVVHSCCGPVQEHEALQFDYETIPFSGDAATGYYAKYFWRDFQLGQRPETGALTPHFSGAPYWGNDYKLSGFAAVGHQFKWSKKGKRFTGGQIPAVGSILKGVMVYDPRLDSTYPGGSGGHRINDENTWTYSTNPALHALTYAYGRYINGFKVFGVDLGGAAINVAHIACWANVCDAYGWEVGGIIYEPGDKWNNLKRICEAGGGQPVLTGGLLSFDYQAPRTSLGTVGVDDLAEGSPGAGAGKGWKDRINTIIPRYRSEANQWNYVQSAAVSHAPWVTADGEEKVDERQWDLVTGKNQVAQLAGYAVYQAREAGPYQISCKPHMATYDPGDCLTLGADLGMKPGGGAVKAIVRSRQIDPVSGTVNLTLEEESDGKHIFAIVQTGTAPTAATLPSAAEIDAIASNNIDDTGPSFDGTDFSFDSTELTWDML